MLEWLLERRRRVERALTSVVATCYLLGVSTRHMEKLVESLGTTSGDPQGTAGARTLAMTASTRAGARTAPSSCSRLSRPARSTRA